MSAVRFRPTDDTQLWVLGTGTRRLPMLVRPGVLADHSEAWWVTPALPSDGAQVAFTHSHLDELSIKHANEAWIMRPESVRLKMTKAPGITPSYYLAWDQAPAIEPVPAPETPTSEQPLSDDVAFVRAVCARRGIPNLPQVTLHYHAICQTALEWLVDDRRPLNLGFARLHALPYRVNWREIIAARLPALGKLLLGRLADEGKAATLDAMAFDEHLMSANMVELTKDGTTFGWNLFAEPATPFERYANEYELASYREHSPESYASRWAALVREARPRLLELLAAFFRQASRPNATVDRRLPPDRRRLLVARQGRVRPAAPPLPVTRAVLPEAEHGSAGLEDSLDVGSDEEVWEMPDVRPQALDVRNDRGEESQQ